ncbi:MAG: hypothetical protein HOV94_38290 [Saccharothrix sp.]|nr:hypothetical protein [Saccharothrix sp.]
MRNLTGRVLAAVLVAGGVMALANPFAAARENTVVLEGLVWFDRDADGLVDEGEPPLVDGDAVRVYNAATKESLGEYRTGADGRYRAEVPDVPLAFWSLNAGYYESTTKSSYNPVTGGGTFDFGLRGGTVRGFSFQDLDGDGVRQSHEPDVPGAPTVRLFLDKVDGEVEVAPPTRGVNGEYEFRDTPVGSDLSIVADAVPERKLAPSASEYDVDPATRRKPIVVRAGETTRVDVRYTYLKSDFQVGTPRLEPARDAYRVGDVVTFVVPLTNRGEAPDNPAMVVFGSTPEFLGANDAVAVVTPGQEFTLRDPIAVGASAEVRLTYRLTDPEFDEFHLLVRPFSALGHRDDDLKGNHAIVSLKYTSGEQSTTTTPTTTTTAPSSTTTTTTTVAAAPVAGGTNGLASTGVAPAAFLALGLLLVGGGALTFLAARRRRRA